MRILLISAAICCALTSVTEPAGAQEEKPDRSSLAELTTLMASDDHPERAYAAFILRVASKSEPLPVRGLSGFAIWVLTGDAEGAIPALTGALSIEEPNRNVIVRALGRMGQGARVARYDLMRIRDAEPEDSPLGAGARQALKLIE